MAVPAVAAARWGDGRQREFVLTGKLRGQGNETGNQFGDGIKIAGIVRRAGLDGLDNPQTFSGGKRGRGKPRCHQRLTNLRAGPGNKKTF